MPHITEYSYALTEIWLIHGDLDCKDGYGLIDKDMTDQNLKPNFYNILASGKIVWGPKRPKWTVTQGVWSGPGRVKEATSFGNWPGTSVICFFQKTEHKEQKLWKKRDFSHLCVCVCECVCKWNHPKSIALPNSEKCYFNRKGQQGGFSFPYMTKYFTSNSIHLAKGNSSLLSFSVNRVLIRIKQDIGNWLVSHICMCECVCGYCRDKVNICCLDLLWSEAESRTNAHWLATTKLFVYTALLNRLTITHAWSLALIQNIRVKFWVTSLSYE